MGNSLTIEASRGGRINSLTSYQVPMQKRRFVDLAIGIAVLGDTVMMLLGLIVSFWVRFNSGWITFGVYSGSRTLHEYTGLIAVGTVFLILAFIHLGIYESRNLLRFGRSARLIVRGATFWLIAFLSVSLVVKFNPPISRLFAFFAYASGICTLLTWRWVFHRLMQMEAVAKNVRQRVIFIGWHNEADRLLKAITNDRSHPYEVIGCVPILRNQVESAPPQSVRVLGNYANLAGILASWQPEIAILAETDLPSSEIIRINNECEKQFVSFKQIASYFHILVSALHMDSISGVPILGLSQLPLDQPFNRALKRAVDIAGSLVGLALSAPIILYCGWRVRRESPGPIFYRQTRMGRNGGHFEIIKIRSMRLDAETAGAQWATKNDPRRLKIGTVMREWNLDEVPQFWNVLKGEMSLVGPRPERPELIEKFKEEIPNYNARHGSKPGITGWAQVNGLRGNTSLEERIRYDLYYMENWSLLLDFQIMLQTFVKRDNAY